MIRLAWRLTGADSSVVTGHGPWIKDTQEAREGLLKSFSSLESAKTWTSIQKWLEFEEDRLVEEEEAAKAREEFSQRHRAG